MALIQCSGCGHMVSDKAQVCPHCGAIVRKKVVRKKEDVPFPLTLILGIVAYGVLSFTFSQLMPILSDSVSSSFGEIAVDYAPFMTSCLISVIIVSVLMAKSMWDRLIGIIVPLVIFGLIGGCIYYHCFRRAGFVLYEFDGWRYLYNGLAFIINLGIVVFAAFRYKKHIRKN